MRHIRTLIKKKVVRPLTRKGNHHRKIRRGGGTSLNTLEESSPKNKERKVYVP
ncbi:unnamed protein product [Meloidogyne enterolobii]|uniref:Uncharacterized protein n=1 Tax=Meloidogyne enterolobii TaxID=390850 RepID=A0ACB0ZFL8_MELEN